MRKRRIPALTLALFAFLTIAAKNSTMAQDSKDFTIGQIRLVALAGTPNTGAPATPNTGLFVGIPPDERAKITGPDMQNSINMFVLRTAGGNYLFDTGLGGKLMSSLAAAGLAPTDINAVVITHFHGDHVDGLKNASGQAAFPNATLYVPREEVAKGPSADRFLPAYAGKTVQFDWTDEILPGVRAVETAGHTPGHTSFMIESGADRLLVAGDLIHFGGVQFARPEVAVTYDTDPARAIATRRKMFDMIAAEGIPMASMHLSFPGVGRIRQDGRGGYAFTPEG